MLPGWGVETGGHTSTVIQCRKIELKATKTIGGAILLLVPLVCSSQNQPGASPGAQPRQLTLAATLDLAARQNLDLAAARMRRAIRLAGERIAGQIPNPTASFTASRDAPHQEVLFDQPLEIGGRRGRRIELAREETALTDVEVAALARQVRRRAREAFYAVAASRAAEAQRGRAQELARRIHEIAQARFDAGDVPQLEVFQADLAVSRTEADLKVAEQQTRVTISQLNALLNERAETLWALAGSLEDPLPPLGLPDLIQRAAQVNPELEHLAAEIRVEQRRHALLRAERIPDVNVEFGAVFNAPGEFRTGGRGGLAVMLPLFSRNQGELAQSVAVLRALDGEAAAARRAVAGRVEAAYYEWTARQTQVELYRQTLVPTARHLAALAEESYRAGKANLLTVLDAQRNVQQVEREYLESLLAMQEAFAELEETVGAPLD